MINGNENSAEKYTEFSEYLLKNIPHENVDEVAIKSLLGSCVEFEGAGVTKNSMIFPNLANPGESVSIKFSNIKFNLNTACDIILLCTTNPLESKIAMLQFVVKILKIALRAVKMVDEDMTNIIRAVYMLSYDNHGASMEKIIEYGSKNGMDETQIRDTVKGLENIKCISLKEGEYFLAETIVLNL